MSLEAFLGRFTSQIRLKMCFVYSIESKADSETIQWPHMTPRQVYERTRFLWTYFGVNRHKQEVLTPSLHAEMYSPDSNRYDLLPFLRPPLTWAYNKIEKVVSEAEQR